MRIDNLTKLDIEENDAHKKADDTRINEVNMNKIESVNEALNTNVSNKNNGTYNVEYNINLLDYYDKCEENLIMGINVEENILSINKVNTNVEKHVENVGMTLEEILKSIAFNTESLGDGEKSIFHNLLNT